MSENIKIPNQSGDADKRFSGKMAGSRGEGFAETSEDQEKFMEMSEWEFDQSPNGWRSLSVAGRRKEAVELIREYILRNSDRIDDLEILYFHIGQLLALEGAENFSEAIEAFKQSFCLDGSELWNVYVSATIAFLEGDIKKVEDAINIIESSKEKDKKSGNLDIIRNFKKALDAGENNYEKVYLESRE